MESKIKRSVEVINVRNIYYMLAYTFQALNISEYKAVEAENFENISDLFAAILTKGISAQVKRGVGREIFII